MPSWAAVWMRTTTSSEGAPTWARAARACHLFVETVVDGAGGVTLIVGCRPDPRLGPLVVIRLGASARNFDTARSIREVLLTWMWQDSRGA